MATKYCLGFYFSEGFEQVLLIKKNRPSFLAGKFNGLGGKIEPGENELEGMTREFEEECGLKVTSWTLTKIQEFPNGNMIYVFYAVGDLSDAITTTDETVHNVDVSKLDEFAIEMNALALINSIIETNERYMDNYIGQKFTVVLGEQIRQAYNVSHIRVLKPNTVATMDQRVNRVNIYLDGNDTIQEIKIG